MKIKTFKFDIEDSAEFIDREVTKYIQHKKDKVHYVRVSTNEKYHIVTVILNRDEHERFIAR